MVDKNNLINRPIFISKLTDVGIAPEFLMAAASTAQRLCFEAELLNPGTLAACNHTDYQHLLSNLARKSLK
jgi:hypothetical protein